MKRIITLLLLIAGYSINAQTLTNPNFENWGATSAYSSDTLPDQWWAMNCNTTHQSTDSYQGTYATRIQGYLSCGIAQGILINGQQPAMYGNIIESGTPFTSKPASISGFYKFTNVTAGDSAEVTIILKRYNAVTMLRDTVAYGTATLAPAGSYSLFTVHLTDILTAATPDSIIIMFNSSKYNLMDMITYTMPNLYIDRIVLPETASGIEENADPMALSLVYPNPFSESATLSINTDLNKYSNVSVHVFDEIGKEVMVIENVTNNRVELRKNKLPKAIYIYQVRSSNALISKGKFSVQ